MLFAKNILICDEKVKLAVLPMSYYIKLIRSKQKASFLKFNHGDWEELALVTKDIVPIGGNVENDWVPASSIPNDEMAVAKKQWILHVFDLANQIKHEDNISVGLGTSYGPLSEENMTTDAKKHLLEYSISTKFNLIDGMFWKKSICNKTIDLFIDELKKQIGSNQIDLIIIGPPHLSQLERLGLDFTHISININLASFEKEKTLSQFQYVLEKNNKFKVVLLQGGLLASWLIMQTHYFYEKVCMINVGRPLDIWCDGVQWVEKNIQNKDWLIDYYKN